MRIPLIIIGAGNVGGFLAYNGEEFDTQYEILGFLDDNPNKIGENMYGLPVLGPIADIHQYENKNIAVVVGIANPAVKKLILNFLFGKKFIFPSFISKSAWVSKNVKIGKGTIIYPGASINYETSIGDFVIMNMNCAIGHNCTISSYSSLAPGVNLAGFTYIEESVDFGIGAATRQNVRIGKNSTIGGQSMLVKDVPNNSVITGVPGRPIEEKYLVEVAV